MVISDLPQIAHVVDPDDILGIGGYYFYQYQFGELRVIADVNFANGKINVYCN